MTIAPHNVNTPHISKTHLLIVSLNLRQIELNWFLKKQSTKKGRPPYVGVEAQLSPNPHPTKSLNISWTEPVLFMEVCIFRMRFNLIKICGNDTWDEMSLNELK